MPAIPKSNMGWRGNKTFPEAHYAQGGVTPGVHGNPQLGKSGGLLTPAPTGQHPIFSPPGQPPGGVNPMPIFAGSTAAASPTDRIGSSGAGYPTGIGPGTSPSGIPDAPGMVDTPTDPLGTAPGSFFPPSNPFAGSGAAGSPGSPGVTVTGQPTDALGGGRGGTGTAAAGGAGGGRGGANAGGGFSYVPGVSDIASYFENGYSSPVGVLGLDPGKGPMPHPLYLQHGGTVPGHDLGYDSQPAMLTPGEVILNKGEQQNVKPTGKLPAQIAQQLYKARKAA